MSPETKTNFIKAVQHLLGPDIAVQDFKDGLQLLRPSSLKHMTSTLFRDCRDLLTRPAEGQSRITPDATARWNARTGVVAFAAGSATAATVIISIGVGVGLLPADFMSHVALLQQLPKVNPSKATEFVSGIVGVFAARESFFVASFESVSARRHEIEAAQHPPTKHTGPGFSTPRPPANP
jgi:hypothetical protein